MIFKVVELQKSLIYTFFIFIIIIIIIPIIIKYQLKFLYDLLVINIDSYDTNKTDASRIFSHKEVLAVCLPFSRNGQNGCTRFCIQLFIY